MYFKRFSALPMGAKLLVTQRQSEKEREREGEKEASDKLSRRLEGKGGETLACGGFLVVQ